MSGKNKKIVCLHIYINFIFEKARNDILFSSYDIPYTTFKSLIIIFIPVHFLPHLFPFLFLINTNFCIKAVIFGLLEQELNSN